MLLEDDGEKIAKQWFFLWGFLTLGIIAQEILYCVHLTSNHFKAKSLPRIFFKLCNVTFVHMATDETTLWVIVSNKSISNDCILKFVLFKVNYFTAWNHRFIIMKYLYFIPSQSFCFIHLLLYLIALTLFLD